MVGEIGLRSSKDSWEESGKHWLSLAGKCAQPRLRSKEEASAPGEGGTFWSNGVLLCFVARDISTKLSLAFTEAAHKRLQRPEGGKMGELDPEPVIAGQAELGGYALNRVPKRCSPEHAVLFHVVGFLTIQALLQPVLTVQMACSWVYHGAVLIDGLGHPLEPLNIRIGFKSGLNMVEGIWLVTIIGVDPRKDVAGGGRKPPIDGCIHAIITLRARAHGDGGTSDGKGAGLNSVYIFSNDIKRFISTSTIAENIFNGKITTLRQDAFNGFTYPALGIIRRRDDREFHSLNEVFFVSWELAV